MRFRRVTLAAALLALAGCTQSQWGFPRTPVAAVSPDGHFTAFIRNHANPDPPSQDIWLEERGHAPIRLRALGGDSEACDTIAWSADGSRVAFLINGASIEVYEAATRVKIFAGIAGRRAGGYPPGVLVKDLSLSADGRATIFNECDRVYRSVAPERQNARGTRVERFIENCTTERRTVDLAEAAAFLGAHPSLAWTLDAFAGTWVPDESRSVTSKTLKPGAASAPPAPPPGPRPTERIELDGPRIRITSLDASGAALRVDDLQLGAESVSTDGPVRRVFNARWDQTQDFVVDWRIENGGAVIRGTDRRVIAKDGLAMTLMRSTEDARSTSQSTTVFLRK